MKPEIGSGCPYSEKALESEQRKGERMSEGRDHGFAHDLTEAFRRNLNFQYGGGDRSYAAGLSLALAHSFFQDQRPPQEMQQVLANELLRRGWNTDLAGAITQSIFNDSL